MTKAFADPLFAGVALLCFAVSGAPLQAVAAPETVPPSHSGSFEITEPDGAIIDVDITGSQGEPAVFTNLSNLGVFTNSARIAAQGEFASGVRLTDATVGAFLNTGDISATSDGSAYAGVYINNAGIETFTNSLGGAIVGDTYGVLAMTASFDSFTNTGLIESGPQGTGLSLQGVNVFQEGVSLTNGAGGRIVGGLWGAYVYSTSLDDFTNGGAIEAMDTDGGIGLEFYAADVGTFANEPGASIRGESVGIAIAGSTFDSFINKGLIEGRTAITYTDFEGRGLTLTNFGTIKSTVNGGVAIDFGYESASEDRDDTLILEDYAAVIGDILFAGGDDTLDVSKLKGGADLRVSGLENLIAGDRVVIPDSDPWTPVPSDRVDDLSVEAVEPEADPPPPPPPSPPDPPTTRVVVVDPATVIPNNLAQSTAGVVQGIAGLIGSQAMSAGYSGSLMSPAAAAGGSAVLTALDIGEAERPRAWGDVFGFGSSGPTPAQLSGLAVGADTKFGDVLSAGALLSYSQSVASFTAGDTLASRTGVAGFYGTYHAGVLDVGFSLLGGVQAHESSRRIATAGGFETAHGSFGGVFAAPGASAALPLASFGGTAVALRASATYVVGITSGYTETGSSSNLTIGPRPITSLDARLGLEARQAIIAGSFIGEGVVRAGVFGLMNGGGATVPVTLFGQTVSVATTPSSVYGIYAGTGAVANLSETIRFELNADTAVRTDGSLSLSLRGGVSGTF